jgi:hypothetical protein
MLLYALAPLHVGPSIPGRLRIEGKRLAAVVLDLPLETFSVRQ